MKKGLLALNALRNDECYSLYDFNECYDAIDDVFKAFKIILKKIHIRLFRQGNQYGFQTTNNIYWISKDKYDLLKKVLYER